METLIKPYKNLVRTKFTLLWMSQLLSQLSIQIVNFVMILFLYEQTHSTTATSFLWVSYALPAIIIGPFSAVVVDVLDRKKVLIYTNLGQSLIVLFYGLFPGNMVFLIYGVVMLYSILNQFYVPAELSALPELVKTKSLPFANSLFFLTQQVIIVIGFGLAGPLHNYFGIRGALITSSVLLFFAFLSTLFLPEMKSEMQLGKKFEDIFVNFFKEIYGGYEFLKTRKDILFPFFMLIGIQVGIIVLTVNIPALAKDILHVKPSYAGILIAVPAGIGAFFGGVVIPKLISKRMRKKKLIETSLLLMAISAFAITVLTSNIDGVKGIVATFLLVMVIGFFFVGVMIPSNTYIQEATPGGFRGRVFGNYWFVMTLFTIFPVIFSGTIADIFGTKALLFLISLFVMFAFVVSRKWGSAIIVNGIKNHE